MSVELLYYYQETPFILMQGLYIRIENDCVINHSVFEISYVY